MPVLKNAKHERFAQALAGGTGVAEAYVQAGYPPNRGNATKLKQKEYIGKRVDELLSQKESIIAQATARAIEKTALTKEWVIERLRENVERAMQAAPAKDSNGNIVGDYKWEGSVANRALELLGKELGMFIDRSEHGKPGDFDRMSDQELADFVRQESGAVSKEVH